MPNYAFARNPVEDRCQSCAAKQQDGNCGYFHDCDTSRFAAKTARARFDSGSEILIQGAPVEKVGVLVSGLVKIVMITKDGDEQLVQLLRPGQIIGDPLAVENAFSWEAATDAEVCWITPTALDSLLRDRPQQYRAFLVAVSRQLQELQLSTVRMRGRNTLERVAFWLVEQIEQASDAANPRLRIALTRRDLASLLDMTVETLCRALHQLAERDAIDLLAPDFIEVSDFAKLRLLARCQDERPHATLFRLDCHSSARVTPTWNFKAMKHPQPNVSGPLDEPIYEPPTVGTHAVNVRRQ